MNGWQIKKLQIPITKNLKLFLRKADLKSTPNMAKYFWEIIKIGK